MGNHIGVRKRDGVSVVAIMRRGIVGRSLWSVSSRWPSRSLGQPPFI